jgi:hypothetical protein
VNCHGAIAADNQAISNGHNVYSELAAKAPGGWLPDGATVDNRLSQPSRQLASPPSHLSNDKEKRKKLAFQVHLDARIFFFFSNGGRLQGVL